MTRSYCVGSSLDFEVSVVSPAAAPAILAYPVWNASLFAPTDNLNHVVVILRWRAVSNTCKLIAKNMCSTSSVCLKRICIQGCDNWSRTHDCQLGLVKMPWAGHVCNSEVLEGFTVHTFRDALLAGAHTRSSHCSIANQETSGLTVFSRVSCNVHSTNRCPRSN